MCVYIGFPPNLGNLPNFGHGEPAYLEPPKQSQNRFRATIARHHMGCTEKVKVWSFSIQRVILFRLDIALRFAR